MKKVPTPSCDAVRQEIPSVPLRLSFSWTFAGNAIYAAGQWAILSVVAKLGSSEMLGQYALAVAVTSPVVMLSHLNLRAVLATDMEERHPFGDYLAVRLATTVLGLVAIAALALASGYSRLLAAAILMTGVAQSVENVSDIYYGAMQRRDRMEQIARSMIARGVLSVAAFGAVLWITRELVPAIAALALTRLVVLLAYDRAHGSVGERLSRSNLRAELTIMRTALPLGVVLMLISLNGNMPRYVIEHNLGTAELGVFAAVASLMTVGSTVINALGQAATPRLARYFNEHDGARFRRLAYTLAELALALGVAGVVVSALLGKVVLGIVYRPEYAAYSGLLVAVMGSATIGYIASMLGYVSTSTRTFAPQMPLFCAVAASSGIASWILVPRFGLYGAALALGVAAFLQIGGQAFILVRAFRRMERAA